MEPQRPPSDGHGTIRARGKGKSEFKGEPNMNRILICDDEPIIRRSLKALLEKHGFDEIIEGSDGEAAVSLALDRMPDIAVLDISMPKKDGITAALEIRKRLKIPIIFLSACQDPEVVSRAVKAGVAAFLSKPVRPEELWPAIELAFTHNEEIERLKEEVEDLMETLETRKVIEKAKGLLMKNHGLGEAEAFRKMQKLAMDKRKSLRNIADAILLTEN
jgi:two-component system, response regulator PdtaR